jgi:hypothetical protein
MNMKMRFFTALLTAATLLTPLSLPAEQTQDAVAKHRAIETYGKLPLSFEPGESAAHFLARSGNYTVSVGERESSVAVTDAKSGKHQTLRFAFDNANPAVRLEALEPQPGVTNYYLGKKASEWRLGVKSYGKLRAQGVYPGVDVVYYGDHRQLEFDFVVAPKADPSAIALSFSGMDKLYKDADGDLVAEVGGKSVRFAKPYAYQKAGSGAKPVDVDYELAGNGKVHLRVANYDRNSELIVDPVVSYVTYLGGSAGDAANGIAVDSTGAAYVTGQTCSSNFPSAISNNGTYYENCDAFVTKFSPDGTTFDYTTIIGGAAAPSPSSAVGTAIALDSVNQAYITGWTNFTELPGNVEYVNPVLGTYPGLNTYQGGDSDAFIVILAANGTLVRSSYLGGSGADYGYGIAVDTSSNVIVVGETCSGDFPAYNAFETKIEACVAFVTKLDNGLHIGSEPYNGASAMTPMDTSGTPYFFSEFYGGQPVAPWPTTAWAPNTYFPPYAIIEDNEAPGKIQIVTTPGVSGASMGTPLPPSVPTNPWNSTLNGTTNDGGITWTNLGPALVLPPTAASRANGVALDPRNDIFVVGGTDTADLGASIDSFGPFSRVHGTGAWILKVGHLDGHWVYGSALENKASDSTATIDTARAIAVDTAGFAYVTGTASSALYDISASSYQPAMKGSGTTDAFLIALDNSGLNTKYGTYLGGTGNEQGLGVAVDGSGAAYVTGSTQSVDFPTINPLTNPHSTPVANAPLTTIPEGTQNAFITKFTTDGSALIFSAYLGGSASDQGNAIALDTATSGIINISTAGNMYVAGATTSNNLEDLDPLSYTPPQTTYGGDGDAFVAMVAGSSLPTVTVSPSSLSFGNQGVGVPSAPVLVQYTNTAVTSSSTVNIASIAFGGANPGDFTQVFPGTAPGDCVPGTIKANASCNIWVVFNPSGSQGRSATLIITDDYSTTPHNIGLSGTGEYPQDSFSVTSLTFAASSPYQTIGTPAAAQSLTLQNVGLGTLEISNIAITGTNPSDFSQSSTCEAQLAYQSSCTLSVIFTPTASGLRFANLTVTDDSPGSPHNIALQGTGAQVKAPTVAPLSLTFSSQPLNVASAALTVTVTNNDTASALSLSAPVIVGAFQVAAQAGSCGTSLPPSSSCVIGVTFTPTVAGALTGTLSITSSASSSPVVVQLTGVGGAAASGAMQLAPTTVAFGNQQVSTTSAAQTVTLTNNSSTSALTVNSIAITGNSDFVIASNNCPASSSTLAANATCSIKVTFTPSKAAAETATLTVTGSASNSPQQITLTGTGTAATTSSSAPFTVTPSTTGISVTQNGTAQYTLSVAPLNGFNNSVAFTCSGPVGSSCSITPNPLVMDGTTTKTATLSVNTTGGNGITANARYGGKPIFLALLPFSIMGMLLMNKRRSYLLMLALLLLCLLLGMVGCGGGSASSTSSGLAPGTYQVVVTAAPSTNSSQLQTMTMNLVVTQQ